MTMIEIRKASPRDPQAQDLLGQSHKLMRRLYAAQDNHALDIDALCAEDIYFVIAYEGETALGCGALKIQTGNSPYGEVKSLFTAPHARGKGAARAIIAALEAHARRIKLPLLRLETGVGLDAAAALYRAMGFETCAAFGDYPESPLSIFFQKQL